MDRREQLLRRLADAEAAAFQAGGEERIAKHHKQGKLTARERVEALLDPGTCELDADALGVLIGQK